MIVNGITIVLLLIIIGILLTRKSGDTRLVKASANSAVILDSCALIDGRVIELAKVGFMPKTIIVPQFILQELQLLADGRDSYKRERARFGLAVVQQLQSDTSLTVLIDQTVPDKKTTDEQLVALAKQKSAELFTTDFNLNQVATIEGVTVLNVNELAHALRPVALPGETVHVSILQAGSNRDQGVGYLDDGTMVVVDGAIKDIGRSIEVTINKSHQTVAGKMLFAKKIVATQQDAQPLLKKQAATVRSKGNQRSQRQTSAQRNTKQYKQRRYSQKYKILGGRAWATDSKCLGVGGVIQYRINNSSRDRLRAAT